MKRNREKAREKRKRIEKIWAEERLRMQGIDPESQKSE